MDSVGFGAVQGVDMVRERDKERGGERARQRERERRNEGGREREVGRLKTNVF